MKIYLASASPTRKRLLKQILEPLGLDFKVLAAEIDEGLEKVGRINKKETKALVKKLALLKADEVMGKLKNLRTQEPKNLRTQEPKNLRTQEPKNLGTEELKNLRIREEVLLIAADTLIWDKNKIFGKPKDKKEALQTLKNFRGRTHWAFTGLVLRLFNEKKIIKEKILVSSAKIYMRNASEAALKAYVESGEPMAKAGSYAIFENGEKFFKVTEGEPGTPAGLPIEKLKELLKDFWV